MKEAVLTLVDVHKIFSAGGQDIPVLRGITISFNQGQRYALTGISGSGKSTLLSILVGLERPTTGSVLYNNLYLATLAEAERERFMREHIGLVFQYPYLLKELTVLENIMLKAHINTISDGEARAQELLERMELEDKAYLMPAALSGGEQQRVALARALIHRPAFLIADEPTAHLDLRQRDKMLDLMLEYAEAYTMGIIISSHDPQVAQRMGTVLNLKNGILA